MRRILLSAVAGSMAVVGCSRPLATARLSPEAPPSPRELEAEAQVKSRRCNPLLALAFPGLGHMCIGRGGEAAVLAGLTVAEVGATVAIAVTHEDDPATTEDQAAPITAPLVALQNLWVMGVIDPLIKTDLAARKLYAPQDSLAELAIAPFNHEVMKRPSVWAGVAGALAVGIGVSMAIDSPGTDRVGDDPELFGQRVDRRWGYPAGAALGVGLFSHVAIGEEILFRGWLQSSLARARGETLGWVIASLGFGAIHLLNLPSVDEEDRLEYALYGVPVITTAGFYLGWLYRHEDYSLAPPVAAHFWYNTLLSAVYFALDPQDNIFTTRISLPF